MSVSKLLGQVLKAAIVAALGLLVAQAEAVAAQLCSLVLYGIKEAFSSGSEKGLICCQVGRQGVCKLRKAVLKATVQPIYLINVSSSLESLSH